MSPRIPSPGCSPNRQLPDPAGRASSEKGTWIVTPEKPKSILPCDDAMLQSTEYTVLPSLSDWACRLKYWISEGKTSLGTLDRVVPESSMTVSENPSAVYVVVPDWSVSDREDQSTWSKL